MTKKLNNKNLDVYIYIKEFTKKNKIAPTYREILDNTNYTSVAGVKSAVDKLEDLGMLKTKRNKNGVVLHRTIKINENKKTEELIEELRNNTIQDLYEND